jgi:predicted RNase H-like HicB family nuclease
MKFTIILEPGEGEIWGRIDAPFTLLTTVGNNVEEVTQNLKDLIQDHLDHEGKEQAEWQNVKVKDIVFDYVYDLTALFEVISAVKINSIADLAGINQSLMRQYTSGVKYPSLHQGKKIQEAVHQLGRKLMQVSM